ncbi:MAG TPA: choice-of-anchor D domain-containing protein [Bacteroidales bacterium]|nr:choice-of-anchor D domain-containing protein [Bacteroidales bacterium]
MKKIVKLAAVIQIICLSGLISLTAQPSAHAKDWSITATYTIEGKASGLAWDGQFIYYGIYGVNGDKVYRFDPSAGTSELLFTSPQIGDSYGMTWDGTNLWIIDQPSGSSNPALATKLDWNGNILETIALPDHYMSGIAYDNGDFWVCTYYPDPGKIYKITADGTILNQFDPPGEQMWDACLENENLWVVDYYDYTICKVDTVNGQVIECHDSESERPAGIVYDGQYLWYVDGPLGGQSTLYKVDLGGSGTPQINIPVTEWNYGNVAVGDSSVWAMYVSNNGTAPLDIVELVIQNAVPVFCWEIFPVTLDPGESTELEIIFRPTEQGPLNTVFQVMSTDPVNPEIDITLTGEAVLVGPAIEIPYTTHNYGLIRKNAHTRWFLEISNIGNANLEIASMTSNDPAFYVDAGTVFPVIITPLQVVEIGIWFNPDAGAAFEGTVTVASNDPDNPSVDIELSGTGVDQSYPIGDPLWHYTINTSWDNSPKAIASISDISGDVVEDVIICSEDNFVRCFNGNSSGIADILWEYEIYSGNVYQQQALSIHNDINNDGYQDVTFGTTGAGSINAICGKTGQPLWTFSTTIWGNGGWVYAVDTRKDYNGDGIEDVLAAAGGDGSGTGPWRAFCLDGTSGSLMWDNFFNGPGFAVISIPDVNSDGIPDALAGASNANETEGKTVCINGSNGSTIWSKVTDGSSVWGLAMLDDINNDGIADVAAGDFMGYYYGYDAVDGDILLDGIIGGSPIITRLYRIEDVSGDGYADLLFGSSSTNCMVVNGYDGSNVWIKSLADKSWNVAVISDVSGDAVNDVIAGTLYSNNYVYYLNGTNGDELKSLNFGEPVDAISIIPDINNDFSMEVVAGGRNGKVYCYSGGLDAWTTVPEIQEKPQFTFIANPNPFHNKVDISVDLPEKTDFQLTIITAGGLLVENLGTFRSAEAPLTIGWNGKNLNPGLYFAVIKSGKHTSVIKLIKQ